jgi:hypothetical protein
VTNDELRGYAGQWVEVQLVSGETLVGRLVSDERGFVLQQPVAGPNEDPPQIGIRDASVVTAIKTVAAPPETYD